MQLKQISVFLENKSGRLSRVTQILKKLTLIFWRFVWQILTNMVFYV